MIPTTPILSSRNQNQCNNRVKSLNKTPSSPLSIKRSEPLNSLSVAAAAAASSLRHSFNVTNNNYNLNHSAQPPSGLPDKLKASFKGRGRHAGGSHKSSQGSNGSAGNENYCNNHGRFQRTLSLDGEPGQLNRVQEAADPPAQQMPQEVVGGGGKNNGKSKRMMFGGSKFSQNSLSFDMRERDVNSSGGAYLKKSHSVEHDDSACEEDEDGVVLRKKQPLEFDENSDDSDRLSRHIAGDQSHQTGILSTFISTSHRNSQLRSTLNKARHHLSFDKWRSSSNHNHHQQTAPGHHHQQSATPNSNQSQDCSSANQSNCSANLSSLSSSNTPPSESPGGRLSRWFSIRRGSSHHYDLNGSSTRSEGRGENLGNGHNGSGGLGRDVRDGGSGTSSRLNSINNEVELAQQIQQQLHQSLSKVISQSNALQQLQQQSAAVTNSNSNGLDKMPLVAEGNEGGLSVEGYQTFGRGMSFRTTSTLKSANPSQMLTPMPTVPPAGLTQQQLKRRHIVAAIAHSEISYVATLSRLVNVSRL